MLGQVARGRNTPLDACPLEQRADADQILGWQPGRSQRWCPCLQRAPGASTQASAWGWYPLCWGAWDVEAQLRHQAGVQSGLEADPALQAWGSSGVLQTASPDSSSSQILSCQPSTSQHLFVTPGLLACLFGGNAHSSSGMKQMLDLPGSGIDGWRPGMGQARLGCPGCGTPCGKKGWPCSPAQQALISANP